MSGLGEARQAAGSAGASKSRGLLEWPSLAMWIRAAVPFSFIKCALVAVLAAAGASCDSNEFAGPTRTGAPVTETFIGTLQPSGEATYAFAMSRAGTVSLTLTQMSGPSIPAGASFPIGIGIPVGQGCTAGVDAAAAPGGSPQYSTTKDLGVYCVRIADNAQLGAPATFALNITHPK